MLTSKKNRSISHLKSIKTDLENVAGLTEFNIWKRTALDSIRTIAPNQEEIIKGIDSLLTIPIGSGLRMGGLDKPKRPEQPFTQEQINNAKNAASTYIDNLVKYIKINGLESGTKSKSFWETNFTVNSLATLWIATIVILLTACTVGFSSFYAMGKNSGKDEIQQQINKLASQSEDLSVKVKVLSDSVTILKIDLKKCQSIANDNANKQLEVQRPNPH